MEMHRLCECLHKDMLDESIMRCMPVGFLSIPCLSMQHVADGRRGFFLLHPFASVGVFCLTVETPFAYRLSRIFTSIGERRTNKTSSKKTSGRTAQTIQSEEASGESEYCITDLVNSGCC